MKLVMKFGGTLMGSPEAIARSAALVLRPRAQMAEAQVVAVVSAMSGVTDRLLDIAAQAEGGDIAAVNDALGELRARHLGAAAALGAAPAAPEVRELRDLLETLRQTAFGVYLLRELSPRSRDLLVSFGERLSAPLMSLALQAQGTQAQHLGGGDAGILTDESFGNARPLPQSSARIREILEPLLEEGVVPVVAGFTGRTVDGATTTLGRGGTDYSATIIGAALAADEVWAWKDVDGVMTADPRIVPGARNLRRLSYGEVMELAYFGAKVLHPLAVTPLQEHGIPLRVKSAADPDFPGTLVSTDSGANEGHPVKAVTAVRRLRIVTVSGAGIFGLPEVVSRLFAVLAREGVGVQMISQSSSMASISLVVSGAEAEGAVRGLRREFGRGEELVREVLLSGEVGVLAIVGEGMRGTPGVSARLFGALREAGVNVLMIAQGSTELNVSVALAEGEVEAAVRAAHDAFDLAHERPALG